MFFHPLNLSLPPNQCQCQCQCQCGPPCGFARDNLSGLAATKTSWGVLFSLHLQQGRKDASWTMRKKISVSHIFQTKLETIFLVTGENLLCCISNLASSWSLLEILMLMENLTCLWCEFLPKTWLDHIIYGWKPFWSHSGCFCLIRSGRETLAIGIHHPSLDRLESKFPPKTRYKHCNCISAAG